MATYKNIKGFGIQYLDSDPANPNIGEVWYNSTTKALKGTTAGGSPSGTWSSGGNMNTGREGGTYFGILSAGVAAGGNSSTNNEEYNGTSWTAGNVLPASGGQGAGAGLLGAGIIMNYQPGDTDAATTYDGTNWTEITSTNTGRLAGTGTGTQTQALSICGAPGSSAVELWNGSSWTEKAEPNSPRGQGMAAGISTAALIAGGVGGSPSTNPRETENYNGTSWTQVNILNSGRGYNVGGGDYTNAITFGGGPMPGVTAKTETWNGTTWSEQADMASASETSFATKAGAGNATYRARIPTDSDGTEEWTTAATVTKTFTVS
jgi:hypothetical protein